MNLTQLQSLPKDRVRALFGLEPAALAQLLAAVLPPLMEKRYAQQEAKKNRKRAVGGGRRRKLLAYQEVLLTLVYLRHNVSHAVCGAMFSVSADISENSFHEVILLLRDVCPADRWDAEKKWTKKEPSGHPDTLDLVLVESFETPICTWSWWRASRRRSVGPACPMCSGSSTPARRSVTPPRRRSLRTSRARCLPSSRGIRVPNQTKGSTSRAKRRGSQSQAAGQYAQAARRADLAYVGVPDMLLPHKKPRGGQLTPQEKEENRPAASARVPVEHGVRRVKAWRILRDEYRLAQGLFSLIALATVGLVHLSRVVPG